MQSIGSRALCRTCSSVRLFYRNPTAILLGRRVFPRFYGNDVSNSKPQLPSYSFHQDGLNDTLPEPNGQGPEGAIDWSRSFHGMSDQAFPEETADILLAPINPDDVEIKPDGILYLPEIKYRRILNKAFGPGGWGLAPRTETIVAEKLVTREYGLVCHGRLIAIARGEMQYFSQEGVPTAVEGCKSNALMRTTKDLGIASELWDPRFIKEFKKKYCEEKFVEHITLKKKKKIWLRKGDTVEYPYKTTGYSS